MRCFFCTNPMTAERAAQSNVCVPCGTRELERLYPKPSLTTETKKVVRCWRRSTPEDRERTMSKSVFAIDPADALSWHNASQAVAGLAERSGFRIRAVDRRWQVWATDADFAAVLAQ